MSLSLPPSNLIPSGVWRQIEDDCRTALKEHLTARRVVDFVGPYGLDFAASNLGTICRFDLGDGLIAGLREVQPLLEVRVPFVMGRLQIDAAARGAPNFDTAAAVDAARRLAEIEDRAAYQGLAAADIRGMREAPFHPTLSLGAEPAGYVDVVTRALIQLDDVAVGGPYALVLGSAAFRRLASSGDSYPHLARIQRLIAGPVLHSRVLEGGLLISQRGGDFELVVGQDAALGYTQHDAERVDLYLIESFTFLILSPEAVVYLSP